MNPIKAAAWNFWYTLSDSETKTIYQLALSKTWELLKQVVRLVVLLTLLLGTVAVWLWSVSFQGGRSLRAWLETKNPTLPEILSAGQALISGVLRTILKWIQTQLKNQYGLEIKLPPIPELQPPDSITTTISDSSATSHPSTSPAATGKSG
ncbi:hypothetical protein J5X98_25880 [Leptothermofonsia sichuanensis E412]|uniref:hypothetical protein n=1 Tax=Leptothermofonsia sichuanensis TaxID=2917832 RepID=UPI001CA64498|nr:hypothetical protein [Leptothermofonsia sichuanensis]QZZ20617.1 hypothetical protein J5X98_25880 [Leptothermofonsia sichuanensis E412]